MAGGTVITGTADTSRVEAPVTVRAYLICAFAAFGGIFFGVSYPDHCLEPFSIADHPNSMTRDG